MFKWEKWIKSKEECEKVLKEYLDEGTIKQELEKKTFNQISSKKKRL